VAVSVRARVTQKKSAVSVAGLFRFIGTVARSVSHTGAKIFIEARMTEGRTRMTEGLTSNNFALVTITPATPGK